MPRAASRDPIYDRRRYTPEVIELCVRWYVTYRLSYRDLSAMMAEPHFPHISEGICGNFPLGELSGRATREHRAR
jgi:hypothetical protein